MVDDSLPARAFAVLSGTIRRSLGLFAPGPDPATVDELGATVRKQARWHRVLGFLEADPLTRASVHVAGGRPEPARTAAVAHLLELAGILGRLSSAGVPVLPLKGPLLSARLWGDPTLRASRDFDLLIPPGRIDDAIAALAPSYLALDWSRRSRAAGEHHEVLQSAATGKEVELHWRLLHPQSGFTAGPMEPWETARRRTDAGVSHLALDPAAESVLVAVHAAHHFGFRLHWLADVAALSVRLESETWERAVDLARRWRVHRALLTAVEAAGLTFDVPLPAALGPAVRKGASHRTAAWMAARLRAGTLKDPPQLEALPRRYLVLDNWRSRLRVTGTLAFTPTQEDRDLTGLPAWADPLTAALRPVFIVKRALTRPKIRTDRSAWQHRDRAE